MITRYANAGYFADLEPDKQGGWVAYEDVVAILKTALQDETVDDIRSEICEHFGIDLDEEID
jgi:hypothetical protein